MYSYFSNYSKPCSKIQLKTILLTSLLTISPAQASSTDDQLSTQLSQTSPKYVETQKSNISGMWSWRIDDASAKEANYLPQGYFTFDEQNELGTLSGHSYAELTFRKPVGSVNSMLIIAEISGKKSGNPGEEKIEFTVTGDNGTEVQSKADIHKNGRILKGSSVSTVYIEGKPMTLKYDWTAKKM